MRREGIEMMVENESLHFISNIFFLREVAKVFKINAFVNQNNGYMAP
jgi:hypothetical protein